MKYRIMRILMVLILGVALVLVSGCTDTLGPGDAPDDEMTEEEIQEDMVDEPEEEADELAGEEDAEDTMEAPVQELEKETFKDPTSGSIMDTADFTDPVENTYFPLTIGTTYIYQGGDEGSIEVEMYVTDQTKEIMGVTTMVVREREWENGELTEDSLCWYANDNEGNVWYFGEDTREYDYNAVEMISTTGSWEAGVDGAEPGILMKADPQVGDVYQQEYYKGEAEDMAEVLSLDASATVEYGSFDNCLQTKEWTALEPGVEEHKYYASGVGLLLEVAVTEGNERIELVEITNE